MNFVKFLRKPFLQNTPGRRPDNCPQGLDLSLGLEGNFPQGAIVELSG